MKVQEKDLSQNKKRNIVTLANTKTVNRSNLWRLTFFVLHTTRQIHEDPLRLTVLACNQASFSP